MWRSALTDRNGEWKIVGEEGENVNPDPYSLITGSYYTRKPEFIVFKPGYCSWPEGYSCRSMPREDEVHGNGEVYEEG